MLRSTVSPRVVLLLASFAIGSATTASAQYSSDRVALRSVTTPAQLNSTFVVDCWGYVSASQREYAVVGVVQGTAFLEITDPANPVIIDIKDEGTLGKDVKVYGDYVYSTNDAGPSYVYDLSDIDNGVVLSRGVYNTNGTHNIAVDEDSGFLYHAIGGPLDIFDLTDPVNPSFVGRWPGETHDVLVVTYDSGPYNGRQIAFVFAGSGKRVDIVDVTDKSNIFRIREVSYPNAAYTHQGWLSGDRQYLYVNDELDGIARTSIFDVSDLSSPAYVGDFLNGTTSTDHNLHWHEGYLFVANYSSGLSVVDATDPVNLAEVGYFDTYPINNNSGFIGAWTAWPYFPSGSVIVSDQTYGLFVLDASEATTPARLATRNGGTNPSSYSAGSPVLGQAWGASVDLSLTGHSMAQVIGYASPANLPLPGGQELLVTGAKRFQLPAKPGPLASWNLILPNDMSLAGLTVYTQAVHLFGVTPYALSNAQDLTLGYY